MPGRQEREHRRARGTYITCVDVHLARTGHMTLPGNKEGGNMWSLAGQLSQKDSTPIIPDEKNRDFSGELDTSPTSDRQHFLVGDLRRVYSFSRSQFLTCKWA